MAGKRWCESRSDQRPSRSAAGPTSRLALPRSRQRERARVSSEATGNESPATVDRAARARACRGRRSARRSRPRVPTTSALASRAKSTRLHRRRGTTCAPDRSDSCSSARPFAIERVSESRAAALRRWGRAGFAAARAANGAASSSASGQSRSEATCQRTCGGTCGEAWRLLVLVVGAAAAASGSCGGREAPGDAARFDTGWECR